MKLPTRITGCVLCFLVVGCGDETTSSNKHQNQTVGLSPLEEVIVEQSGKSFAQLRAESREREAARRVRAEERQTRINDSMPESKEPVQCDVTPENATLSPEKRAELEAELMRTAVPSSPPGYRESNPMPTEAELGHMSEPIEVTRPTQELLDRQAAYFEGRERAMPDLSRHGSDRRSELSREIEWTAT